MEASMSFDDIGLNVEVDVGLDVAPRLGTSPGFVEALSYSDEGLIERMRQLEESEIFQTLRQFGIIIPLLPAKAFYIQEYNDFSSRADNLDHTNLDQCMDFLENFVLRKGLSQQLFEKFLHGEIQLTQIVEYCECSKDEAYKFSQAMRAFDIATTQQQDHDSSRISEQISLPSCEISNPLLRVQVNDKKEIRIYLENSSHRRRYLIQNHLLRKVQSLWQSNEVQDLLRKLSQVNDVLAIRLDIARRIIRYQRTYIESGDTLKLRYLSQVQLAKEVDKHPSTVLRAIRKRIIVVDRCGDEQIVPLENLCGRRIVSLIVSALVKTHPGSTDRELLQILNHDYGTKVKLRTVNYHRNKFQRRRKMKRRSPMVGQCDE
jgi:DNA-directed RNA polymerase specialized sigma54-like protein